MLLNSVERAVPLSQVTTVHYQQNQILVLHTIISPRRGRKFFKHLAQNLTQRQILFSITPCLVRHVVFGQTMAKTLVSSAKTKNEKNAYLCTKSKTAFFSPVFYFDAYELIENKMFFLFAYFSLVDSPQTPPDPAPPYAERRLPPYQNRHLIHYPGETNPNSEFTPHAQGTFFALLQGIVFVIKFSDNLF